MSTTPGASPPVVQRFALAVVERSRSCTENEKQVQLEWVTTGATTVSLVGPGAPSSGQPPSGTSAACIPSAVIPVYDLTATGPGGTTTDSVTDQLT